LEGQERLVGGDESGRRVNNGFVGSIHLSQELESRETEIDLRG
jgi:hypothetical protein